MTLFEFGSGQYIMYKSLIPGQYLYYVGDDTYSPDLSKALKLSNENYAKAIAAKKGIKYEKL